MNNKNRVLAYQKATALSDEALKKVSGGGAKYTVERSQTGTGYYPGPLDVELDQVWD